MRLLKAGNNGHFVFTKDLSGDDIPRYAILSHAWGDDEDEVTYNDLKNGTGRDKLGYAKLEFCANQAREDGLEHFWVDTCCINKVSHAELAEAINSMFRWYHDARLCYVYLADVSIGNHSVGQNSPSWDLSFRASRWFTRGWTLQELIAPRSVLFFSQEREFLGDKLSLKQQIHEVTGIPVSALLGTPPSQYSVGERMRWSAKRSTKKKEDQAYCLMGIFGVFMLPIYGEGDNAFARLREEISKRSSSDRSDQPHKEMTLRSTPDVSRNVHWIVNRAPNALFTGRVDILQLLQDTIICAKNSPSMQQCRIVVTGIGGQGKSELCLQLAHRLRELFWAVFWIDVSTTSAAESTFMEVARRLALPASDWRDACLSLANLKHPWLLVLDNADDPDLDYQPYLPSSRFGVVMLSSRNIECQQYATIESVALEGLSDIDACNLLNKAAYRSHMDDVTQEDAMDVAQLLRSHPLALIQAGAYIRQGYCTMANYPTIFEQQRQRLLGFRPRQASSRYGDVYATFEASAAILKTLNTDAADHAMQLLSHLAVCGFNRLPIALWKAAWKAIRLIPSSRKDHTKNYDNTLLTPWHIAHAPQLIRVAGDSWESFRIIEALNLLRAFSLVTTESSGDDMKVSMHPLVHAWARDRQDGMEQHKSWLRMGCLFALACLSDFRVNLASRVQQHLEMLTSWRLDKMFSDEPSPLVTRILVRCGHELRELRRDQHLSSLLKNIFKHLQLDEQRVVPQWLGLYELAAENLSDLGYLKPALDLQQQVVEIRQASLTATDNQRLRSKYALATIYLDNNQVVDALKLMEHIVDIRRRTLAKTSLDRLNSERFLARVYLENGQTEDALALLEEVVSIQKQVLAETSPHLLTSKHVLARAYLHDEQVTAALALLQEVVKTEGQTLPKTHPSRLESQHVLGNAYLRNGQVAEALALFEEVVEIEAHVLPKTHHSRLMSQYGLALAYYRNGQVVKAMALLKEVIVIEEQTLSPDHPDRLISQQLLADCYWALGNREAGFEAMKEIVSTYKQILPGTSTTRESAEQQLQQMANWMVSNDTSCHECDKHTSDIH